MCGIAGQMTFDNSPVSRRRISLMGTRLRHRGPDDAGIYVHGSVGLAHQRSGIRLRVLLRRVQDGSRAYCRLEVDVGADRWSRFGGTVA